MHLKKFISTPVTGLGAALVAVLLVAACGGSGSDNAGSRATLDRYALANKCLALQSVATGQTIGTNEQGAFVAGASGTGSAISFYMKPTTLGKYMFYTPREALLVAADNGSVARQSTPALKPKAWNAVDESAEWTIKRDGDGHFTVVSKTANRSLAVKPNGLLALAPTQKGDPAQQFEFVPARGCAEFPEIEVRASPLTSYSGTGVEDPVLGFADIHNHISATDFLGGAHVGRPFSQFGVAEALGNGAYVHGDRGRADLVGNLYTGKGLATHDTQGWPTFDSWPARDALTHEGTYYRWIKRAWLAGLRVLNNNVVENQVLCTVQSVAQNGNLSSIKLRKVIEAVRGAGGEYTDRCNSVDNTTGPDTDSQGPHEVVGGQIVFMHRMEDYIDAQNGGPGEGWFRIVTSPAEARRVINQGKLAVYLGIEHSHLFGCSYRQKLDRATCTKEQIDKRLDELYAKGVRQVNIMHEFNNGLGGNGIFNPFILNLGNFIDTGGFWQTKACTEIDADYTPSKLSKYLYTPGANLVSLTNPGGVFPENPLSGLLNLILGKGLALPAYPTDKRQCNVRGLTELGRYAVKKIMAKGMLIDIDHLSLKMKSQVINIAKKYHYPLISTHGGQGGISNKQAKIIYKLGGLIYPMSHDADTRAAIVEKLRKLHAQAMAALEGDEQTMFAVGYGADTNGLATQPAPRPDGADQYVTYPFQLFRGPAWGSQFDRVNPIIFRQSGVPEGNRFFSLKEEGVAHYGMFADWVKSVAIVGGEKAIDTLYRSAEAFLRTWERAVAAGKRLEFKNM